MDALEKLRGVIEEGRAIRELGDGIYSVLADEPHAHLYDRRAAVYDLVVGTRIYNRLLWGSSPRVYAEFARRAFSSQQSGMILDAPCGSMLFSLPAYLECERHIVAFDQSLAMLRRARERLSRAKGFVPENVLLLQADLGDLPFKAHAFQTVLCMNVLHLFEDAASLLPKLDALLADGGSLCLTSLVKSGRFVGDRYLDLLHASGEFVRPRGGEELRLLLNRTLRGGVSYRVKEIWLTRRRLTPPKKVCAKKKSAPKNKSGGALAAPPLEVARQHECWQATSWMTILQFAPLANILGAAGPYSSRRPAAHGTRHASRSGARRRL